ncbi:putative DNA-binding domain-containing protein [Paucibacter sp. B2R-40]|uniref:HvfC/BufC N-terminal domain-containing protein n=1 Tax=Paucibacter sp. B2R-40 TaxID=2893554 RepID=UPI0021E40B02|nr:DNA-binding domain-containing protein [Paucibacter sp. B2R-40]MCV2353108.1 putative DNA-binding domain-containing protein [Paucibacter sp. B2R-40]
MSAALKIQQQAMQEAVCARADPTEPEALLQEPATGLAIYREAYSARLLAALRDNFTVLQRALGDADFDALGLAYIQARPSRQPSIRWFGADLAAFMADQYADQLTHPCMVEFARMDWALRAAFDSADAPVLRFEQVAATATEDWPALVFSLQPSVHLLAMNWAIEPAWSALRAHEPGSDEAGPVLSEPAALDHHLLVWREGLETYWRSLEPLEAQLLQALAAGQNFEAICQQAALTVGADQAAAAVVQALQGWLARGLLSDVQSRAS